MTKVEYIKEIVDLATTPSTPSAGHTKLYRKTDGQWYYLDDAGVESPFGGESPLVVNSDNGLYTVVTTNITGYQNMPTQNILLSAMPTNNFSTAFGGTFSNNVMMLTNRTSNSYSTLQNNVMAGNEVLYTATGSTLTNSVLLGFRAAYQNSASTVTGLVAIGPNSGSGSVNASRSIFIGELAGQLVDENNTTAIGYRAGYGAQGVFTTAVGYSAYSSISSTKTGSQNTMLGAFAGGNLTTGQYNTAIGTQAVRLETTGSNNTGVGRWALQNGVGNSDNTAIGMQAGWDSGSFSKCIFLGSQARFNASGTTEDNVCLMGGVGNAIKKLIIGGGYQESTLSSDAVDELLIRPSYRSLNTTHGVITDLAFEAGNSSLTGFNNGNIVFRTADPSTASTGVTMASYVDALTISGANGTAGHLFASAGASCDGATWTNASDRRLKEKIKTEEKGLEAVKQLKPKNYYYKGKDRKRLGFIAQDLEQVVPEVVSKNAKGDLNVDYAGLIAVMANAIQELEKKVEELENVIAMA